jgi:hypothetical protein
MFDKKTSVLVQRFVCLFLLVSKAAVAELAIGVVPFFLLFFEEYLEIGIYVL